MTIRKGEPWGRPGALPAHGVVVRTDAEARAIVTAARRATEPVPPLGLLGGEAYRVLSSPQPAVDRAVALAFALY